MLKPTATIELVYIDESGSTGATMLNIPSSSTIEDGDAAAMALASFIAPTTDAVLIKYRISYKWVPDSPPALPSSGDRVNAGLLFFACVSDAPDAIVTIPAIKSDLLVEDGPTAGYAIDLSDSRVLALLGELLDDSAVNPFGDAIVTIAAGYLQSRV